jgi:uncharacterized membrane protein YozB (DUF420 family)
MVARSGNRIARFSDFILALIITAVVVAGFGQTVNARLLHPPSPRPSIIAFHAVIFMSWVILFVIQSVLIATDNVKLHRKIGMVGLALGITVPVMGIATTIVNMRFSKLISHRDPAPFLAISLNDMIAFSVFFGLAMYWRKKSDWHRRLMFIATCTLTSAAFLRLVLPTSLESPIRWQYVGVDALILLGLARDWIVNKRIHPVFLYSLPAVVLAQLIAEHLYLSGSPAWVAIADWLLG